MTKTAFDGLYFDSRSREKPPSDATSADNEIMGLSKAPHDLESILIRIGRFLKWPPTFEMNNEVVSVPLRDGNVISFAPQGTKYNYYAFRVEYRFVSDDYWIVCPNGIATPNRERILLGTVLRGKGEEINDALKARNI